MIKTSHDKESFPQLMTNDSLQQQNPELAVHPSFEKVKQPVNVRINYFEAVNHSTRECCRYYNL